MAQSNCTLFRNTTTTATSAATTTSHKTAFRFVIALHRNSLCAFLLCPSHQSHPLPPVELANHSCHIKLSLPVRRHPMILIHRSRPRVISRQCLNDIVVIPRQQCIQISRSTRNILLRTKSIHHTHLVRSSRHQLHQSFRARSRYC